MAGKWDQLSYSACQIGPPVSYGFSDVCGALTQAVRHLWLQFLSDVDDVHAVLCVVVSAHARALHLVFMSSYQGTLRL
jgi:hypothetical protein